MFEIEIQVLIFFKNISSNKFGMLKTYLLNNEENIDIESSPYIYIYINIMSTLFLITLFSL
jgi:hypothetical protein